MGGRVDDGRNDPARALSCHWRATECSPDGHREGPASGLPVISGRPLLAAHAQGRLDYSHRTHRPRDALRRRGVAPSAPSSRQASSSRDYARYPKPQYLADGDGPRRREEHSLTGAPESEHRQGHPRSHAESSGSHRDRRMRGARRSASTFHARHGSGRSSAHGRAGSATQRITRTVAARRGCEQGLATQQRGTVRTTASDTVASCGRGPLEQRTSGHFGS
jgi:hypothetical protein